MLLIVKKVLPGLLLVFLMLNSCQNSDKGTGVPKTNYLNGKTVNGNIELKYDVSFDSIEPSICRVKVEIVQWPDSQNLLFQYPVYYADNPIYPLPDLSCACFIAVDTSGKRTAVAPALVSTKMRPFPSFVAPTGTKSIEYEVRYGTKGFGIPYPSVANGTYLFDGAYVFILPILGQTYPAQWRTPIKAGVTIHSSSKTQFVGQDSVSQFETNYELMFVRGAVNPKIIRDVSIGEYEVLFYNTSSTNIPGFDNFEQPCSVALAAISDSMFSITQKRLYIGIVEHVGGLEGIQGFWIEPSYLRAAWVYAHELFHIPNGIMHGDVDDLWWKEGLATYLHILLASQRNLDLDYMFSSCDDFYSFFTDTFPQNQTILQYSLRNCPRDILFPLLPSTYQWSTTRYDASRLIYRKGAQAAMMLDRYIINKSNKSKSLYSLIKLLNGPDSPKIFTNEKLTNNVGELTGDIPSARVFLDNLLNQTGPYRGDSLKVAIMDLITAGRYNPWILPPYLFKKQRLDLETGPPNIRF